MQNARSSGFTIIELVVVIIILGVLAAIALPKFYDIGKEARLVTIEAAYGSAFTAAESAHLKCVVTEGCYTTLTPYGAQVAIGPNGQLGTMYHGYPTGLSRPPFFFGLKDWMTISSGITVFEVSPQQTEIRVDGAVDPMNCKVTYFVATGHGEVPTITKNYLGC